MPLADGDPAEAWDTWLRVITDRKYLKSDGTLSNNAFSGKRVIAPPAKPRPWSIELSGALLSIIDDLTSYGRGFCGDRFAGYMFQLAGRLRNPDLATDVVYTPTADPAHADLVSYRLSTESKYALRDWLQDSIRCANVDDVGAIDTLRRG